MKFKRLALTFLIIISVCSVLVGCESTLDGVQTTDDWVSEHLW